MTSIVKAMYDFPTHLNYVATLPWEVKKLKVVKRYKIQLKSHIMCDENETFHVI